MDGVMKALFGLMFVLLLAAPAAAFMEGGCGAGKCSDCHHLTVDEASNLLGGGVDRVLKVDPAEMPGIWAVEVEKKQQKFPVYIDYSKSYVVTGNIIRLADKKNLTQEQVALDNRVDVTRIPLKDALVLGDPQAKTRVIVFTDPECPFCRRLHAELKKVVAADPQIVFFIKLFPLKMHPTAYTVAKSIACNHSLELLEDSYAGKPVPPPLCTGQEVDDNLALAAQLGIHSTPTLIFPDGSVRPGYRSAADLLTLLGSDKTVAGAETAPLGQKP
jgi:thiol:disulfide interchange protein DsbC